MADPSSTGEDFEERCRRYSYFSSINTLLNNNNFSAIDNNEERITFVLHDLASNEDHKYISNTIETYKNTKTSTEFRIKGNHYFTSSENCDLNKAVEEYSKSAVYAQNESRELSLAYANRSAALFEARLISDCLLDIDRTLKNNYPDNLKAKLYLRKAMCLQILDIDNCLAIDEMFTEAQKWTGKMETKNQKILEKRIEEQKQSKSIEKFTFSKWNSKKFLPKLNTQNPEIPGLSNSVGLKYSKNWGRHIVATKDVRPGETIGVERAYAKVVLNNSRYKLCWNCGEQTWACVPCENCVEVVFCSEICRNNGNLEHHNLECPIIKSIIRLTIPDTVFLSLRVITKSYKEVEGSIETLERNIRKFDAEKKSLVNGLTSNKLDPGKFSSFYCLESHVDEKKGFRGLILGYAILVAYLLATKTKFFGAKLNGDLTELALDKKFIFIIGLCEKVIDTSLLNNFHTSSFNNKKTNHENSIGSSIVVPALSFFNHSCITMLSRSTHGDFTVTTALCPINKGDQIFICYGPNYKKATRKERQEKFLQNYNFFCKCEACKNNWPQEPVLNRNENTDDVLKLVTEIDMIDKKCNTERDIGYNFGKHDHVHDVSEDRAKIVEVIEKLHSLHYERNCSETSNAEEVLVHLLTFTEDRYLSLTQF